MPVLHKPRIYYGGAFISSVRHTLLNYWSRRSQEILHQQQQPEPIPILSLALSFYLFCFNCFVRFFSFSFLHSFFKSVFGIFFLFHSFFRSLIILILSCLAVFLSSFVH